MLSLFFCNFGPACCLQVCPEGKTFCTISGTCIDNSTCCTNADCNSGFICPAPNATCVSLYPLSPKWHLTAAPTPVARIHLSCAQCDVCKLRLVPPQYTVYIAGTETLPGTSRQASWAHGGKFNVGFLSLSVCVSLRKNYLSRVAMMHRLLLLATASGGGIKAPTMLRVLV